MKWNRASSRGSFIAFYGNNEKHPLMMNRDGSAVVLFPGRRRAAPHPLASYLSSHSVMPGHRYMMTMQTMTIRM
ncbi:MAG: hypothetical protein QOK29_5175 [Rhodospirillaceae bacterium]|jgi:hypothetical protein|nr:hypothetical protein [Rhodospirillaceae bacterium]